MVVVVRVKVSSIIGRIWCVVGLNSRLVRFRVVLLVRVLLSCRVEVLLFWLVGGESCSSSIESIGKDRLMFRLIVV